MLKNTALKIKHLKTKKIYNKNEILLVKKRDLRFFNLFDIIFIFILLYFIKLNFIIKKHIIVIKNFSLYKLSLIFF